MPGVEALGAPRATHTDGWNKLRQASKHWERRGRLSRRWHLQDARAILRAPTGVNPASNAVGPVEEEVAARRSSTISILVNSWRRRCLSARRRDGTRASKHRRSLPRSHRCSRTSKHRRSRTSKHRRSRTSKHQRFASRQTAFRQRRIVPRAAANGH